ncbi:S-layer homology domain-containing protein, partial [Bifidobacterium callitrichidarum]
QYADGVFGTDLYAKYGKLTNNGYEFTGWYTSPDAGGQAVDPSAKLDDGTTLYAHWAVADSSETSGAKDSVTFNTKGLTEFANGDPDGAGDVVTVAAGRAVYVRLASGDQLANWQIPSDDVAGDGYVFTGWDQDVASAKRGDVLTAKADEGVTVNFGGSSAYGLYKDGKLVNAKTAYDVALNATLDDYQAVKGANTNNPELAYAWQYTVGSGTSGATKVEHGQSLSVPKDAKDITVTPTDFQKATEYRVHLADSSATSAYNKYYFTTANSTFKDAYNNTTLEELTRINNSAFAGWFDLNGTFLVNGTPKHVASFFTPQLVKKSWDTIAPNTVPTYDFDSQHGQGIVDIIAGYEAAAQYRLFTVYPLYDQAKAVTVKLYNDQTIGSQLKALDLERSGYSIEGYYTSTDSFGKVVASSKIDTTKTVDNTYPTGDKIYVNYTLDAKYGVNGLLSNLARGYATGLTTSTAVKEDGSHAAGYYYATYTLPGVPIQLNGGKKIAGQWAYTTKGSGAYVLVQPEGTNDASWKDFLTTRRSVVLDLLKYFKLSTAVKSSDNDYQKGQHEAQDIVAVYKKVADNLSAEKADEFAQEFAGKIVADTSYPDVNYDDYGTHNAEITYLTSKGIVKGYADGTFGYGAPLARVDYIVWLYRAAGSPAVDSQAPFSDVNATTVPNKDFRDAIAWAAANKITTGYPDGTFAPYATLNRQDAAAFLYRAAGSPKFNESYADVKFSDVTPGDSAN